MNLILFVNPFDLHSTLRDFRKHPNGHRSKLVRYRLDLIHHDIRIFEFLHKKLSDLPLQVILDHQVLRLIEFVLQAQLLNQ
jgi:hypothetical protein